MPLETGKEKGQKGGCSVCILFVYLIPFVPSGLGPSGTGKDSVIHSWIHMVQDKMVQGNSSVPTD